MSEGVIGLILAGLLLGGIFLFARRPTALTSASAPVQTYNPGNIRMVPMEAEPRRYQNKETREIEYNGDGLPTKIVITRDSVVA